MASFMSNADKSIYVPGSSFRLKLYAGTVFKTDDKKHIALLRKAVGVVELAEAKAEPEPEPDPAPEPEPDPEPEVDDEEKTPVRVKRTKK